MTSSEANPPPSKPQDTPATDYKGDWRYGAVAFVCFASLNVALNYFNAWALRKSMPDGTPSFPGFDFPFFYTMWHMMLGSLAALLLLATVTPPKVGGMPSFRQLYEYADALVPIAVCSVLSIGLNNFALTLVSLFINQVIKACGPLTTCGFEYLIAKTRYSAGVIVSVLLIVAGGIMACTHQILTSKGKEEEQLVAGILLCVIALLAASLKPVIAMLVMGDHSKSTLIKPRPKLSPQQALFYDCSLAFVMMLIVWLCLPERAQSVAYLGSDKAGVGVLVVALGASMGFLFNLSVYYFVLTTSALTSQVGANAVKIGIITGSAASMGITDPVSITGIVLEDLAIVAYVYFNYTEREKAKADDEHASGSSSKSDSSSARAPPDEKTALNPK